MAKVELPSRNAANVQKEYFSTADKVPAEAWYWAAVGSILVSSALFLANKRDWSIFVGQWPPTFILFGLFHKIIRSSR